MKKIVAFLLVVVLTLGCCACGDSTPKKKKKYKVVYIDEPSTSDTSSDENDSQDDNSDSISNNDYIGSQTSTTIEITSKVTSASIGNNYYYFSPEFEHPGVVGLDAHYNMVAKDRRGQKLDSKRIVMVCDNKEVKQNGNVLTIPYSVRNLQKPITVTMYDSKYPNRTGTYTFNFRKFSAAPTFEDEFDTLNKEVWSENWYPTTIYGECSDGKLICTMTNKENRSIEMATSGTFRQSFGCFSARIKMPDRGTNNAGFWLCSDYWDINNQSAGRIEGLRNPQSPSQSGIEIDVVEYSAAWNNRYAATCHWYGWSKYHRNYGKEGLTIDGLDFAADFNIWSVVWTEDAYYWYLNDQLMSTYSGEGVGYGPVAILVQLSNHTTGGWVGTFEDVYPYTAEFDWVRAWSLDDLDWTKTAYGKEFIYE